MPDEVSILPGRSTSERPLLGCFGKGLLTVALLWYASPAFSLDLPPLDFTARPGDRRQELLEQKRPGGPETLRLPAPPAPLELPAGSLLKSVLVKKIVVSGSSILSEEEIGRIVAPYENRPSTMEALEALRRDLTLAYVNRGYINSGAILPDQTVTDGTVHFQIVEGRLSAIEVEGKNGFSKSYLQDRIHLAALTPLNIYPLQERLQLLQQHPHIQRITAELRPGLRPGESELKVRVEEKPPMTVSLAFNNYQSPSVGAERGLLTLAHQNLTGHGDALSLTYGYSDGVNPLIDTSYAIPLNAHDTTLLLRYRKNDFVVVDEGFKPLDIVSKSEGYEISLRQPVFRTLYQEFALALSVEREENRTSLLGEPFSFSPGVENGKSVVTPLRFVQDWTYRTQRQVFAARSRFSFGLDALGATTHGEGNLPDGKFFAWLGQVQWARVLDLWEAQLLARVDVQRANDPLLPVEQFPVGGRYSVRGYRENLLVRDQALIASLESRIPLIQHEPWAEYLQICPFFDYGHGSNVAIATPGPQDISSVGLGLRWAAKPVKSPFELQVDAEIYWGHPLRDLHTPHDDLQDDGIHLQVALTAFF